jgi:hypothetical protein
MKESQKFALLVGVVGVAIAWWNSQRSQARDRAIFAAVMQGQRPTTVTPQNLIPLPLYDPYAPGGSLFVGPLADPYAPGGTLFVGPIEPTDANTFVGPIAPPIDLGPVDPAQFGDADPYAGSADWYY